MLLVALLLAYLGIGIMAAILDYWDFEDMVFRYEYAYLEKELEDKYASLVSMDNTADS